MINDNMIYSKACQMKDLATYTEAEEFSYCLLHGQPSKNLERLARMTCNIFISRNTN